MTGHTQKSEVQIFTVPDSDDAIGFRIEGERSGPNILVAARSNHAMCVFEAISKAPAARPVRGTLYLIDVKTLDTIGFIAPVSTFIDEVEVLAAQHFAFIPSQIELTSSLGKEYLDGLLQTIAGWLRNARC